MEVILSQEVRPNFPMGLRQSPVHTQKNMNSLYSWCLGSRPELSKNCLPSPPWLYTDDSLWVNEETEALVGG